MIFYDFKKKAGFMKARIRPDQLKINVSEDAPIPKCHIEGYNWGEIVHQHDVTWLAGYKDFTINKHHKYVFLAATSKFKSKNDRKKYEKARMLKACIKDVRNDYEKKMRSKDERISQMGTAAYLIDKLALRVGNEKGEDEADTVGNKNIQKINIHFNHLIY